MQFRNKRVNNAERGHAYETIAENDADYFL